MALTVSLPDWDTYRMDCSDPHREVEPPAAEIAAVDTALTFLADHGLLPQTTYDRDLFLAHRAAVRDSFEIPWTAITPRMQRLLYALNALHRPAYLLAAGIFCGNTFISNAGAAVGPGACYRARRVVGVEILPEEAQRAARNVAHLDPEGRAEILAADAVEVAAAWTDPLDLLYLDADGRGKEVYLDILRAAYDRLPPGALVLAHNSVNCAERLATYLAFVRDPAHFRASVNVVLDGEGLEVSAR